MWVSESSSSSSPPPPPPPPTKSSSKEKKLYLCVETVNKKKRVIYNWYAIDNDDDNETEFLSAAFELPPILHAMYGFAAWKSYIYIFGGLNLRCTEYVIPPISEVYYIDTRFPRYGWKRGPDLIHGRHHPYGVTVDDKIYVLGGLSRYQRRPYSYAEFLDLSNSDSQWSYMEGDPDVLPKIVTGHAVQQYANDDDDDDNITPQEEGEGEGEGEGGGDQKKKIFFYGHSPVGLYCYDFHNGGKWEQILRELDRDEYQSALVDGIMYFVEGDTFKGYDLRKRQWYQVLGLDKEGVLPDYTPHDSPESCSLLHLGNGTLYLVWSCSNNYLFTPIHCTKFTIRKEELHDDDDHNCTTVLTANIKSFKIYMLKGSGMVRGSLAIGINSFQEPEQLPCKSKSPTSYRDPFNFFVSKALPYDHQACPSTH